MKIWYKIISSLSGAVSFLASLLCPIFVIVSLPVPNSTAITGFAVKHIFHMFSNRSFYKFVWDLFKNPAYADFSPSFITAFVFFWTSAVLAVLIVFFSLKGSKYIYNTVCSGLGVVFLVISALGISSISKQAEAGYIAFGSNVLDIFDNFVNVRAVNCGGAFFLMGLCFLIVFIISGSLVIVNGKPYDKK